MNIVAHEVKLKPRPVQKKTEAWPLFKILISLDWSQL